MTKWEQEIVFIDRRRENIHDLLQKRGADGWELVSHTAPQPYSDDWSFAFKRPIE